MRLIFIKILLLFSNNSFAQWDLIYTNDSLACRDIHFFDADTGIIIGTHTYNNSDFIMKTFDGGQSWDTTYLNNVLLWTIDFPSRDTGYIAFANPFQVNVMRTIDGGNSWQQTTNNLLVGNTRMDIKFYDNNNGVLSMGGYSWKTADAGINWNLITTNPDGGEPNIFVTDSILFGVAGNFVTYSFDTCLTFNYTVVYNNTSGNAVYSKNGKVILGAIGQDGSSLGYGHINYGVIAIGNITNFYFSIIHFPHPAMYSIFDVAITDNFYYATGLPFNDTVGSQIIKSSDGINWFRQESSEPGGFPIILIERVFCLNDTLCYAYGGGRIYKTSNGGGTMLQQAGVWINDVDEIGSENSLSVYPNPFTNSFSITSEEIIQSIKIVDLTGKFIYESKPNSSETIVEPIISNGVYLIEVISETKTQIKKIIKI
jgi:photosystem II stability/assembly factor-like uncharacterized protein